VSSVGALARSSLASVSSILVNSRSRNLRYCELACKLLLSLTPSALVRSQIAIPSRHMLILYIIVVFGVNDVYDYESDLRNPRKIVDGLEGTVLHPVYHTDVLRMAYASSVYIIASTALTAPPQNVAATSLLVLLGWQYSSPPLRLKEMPVADSVSNGTIVFLAWFIGFSFTGHSIMEAPMKGYMLSLCTAGMHALGAVVDAEVDQASGQRTIATVLGKRPTALFASLS
jgi:4-hydroxybenzoate polyprenyltransferase